MRRTTRAARAGRGDSEDADAADADALAKVRAPPGGTRTGTPSMPAQRSAAWKGMHPAGGGEG